MSEEGTHGKIYAVVRRVPRGRVTTYGDVAVLAGMPGQARLVGYALHALPEHTSLPWHRVINAQGGISLGRAHPGGELVQRQRLEAEGLEFRPNGRVDLKKYRWAARGLQRV
jgi:methylated-DNA-protein-cysteine methyltransferase related protein